MVRCGRTIRTRAQPPDTPCSLGGGAVGERLSEVEPLCTYMRKGSSFLVGSVMELFKEVQGGVARCGRTTPN